MNTERTALVDLGFAVARLTTRIDEPQDVTLTLFTPAEEGIGAQSIMVSNYAWSEKRIDGVGALRDFLNQHYPRVEE